MHTELSLKVLDSWTTALGKHLRHFQSVTCVAFNTYETQREREARQRAEARRQPQTPGSTQQARTEASSSRRPKTFNLTRYKVHALGDYIAVIWQAGPTDNYTTQMVGLCVVSSDRISNSHLLCRLSLNTVD